MMDSINPSVAHKIKQSRLTCSKSQYQELAVLSMDIRLWIKENVELLELSSDKIQELDVHILTHYVPQATCELVNGHCLLSIVGATAPAVSLERNTDFFTGGTNTGRSVINAIQTLADSECSFSSGDLSSILALTSFTNFFNWLHKRYGRDEVKAAELLSRYLCLMQPLIVTNLGGAQSAFSESQTSALVKHVGVARLMHVADGQQPIHMISIPQFHPGYDAYGSQPQAYHKLRFLCWISVWTHMDVAFDILAEYDRSLDHQRRTICIAIMDRAKVRLQRAGYYSTLTLLQEEVVSYVKTQAKVGRLINDDKSYQKQNRRMSNRRGSSRAEIAAEKEFLESTRKLGAVYGSGAEGTKKRVQQMEQSWRVHKEYICEALQISEKNEFRIFYEDQPQGFFLRACIEATKAPHQVAHELRTVADRWYAENCETSVYSTGSLQVTERLDLYQKFAQHITRRQAMFEQEKPGRCPKLQVSEVENFDGGTKFGPFTIDVVSRTGEKRKIRTPEFQKQVFKKRTYLDKRVLRIHADGIDIQDELGNTIYLGESGKAATIQQDEFSKFKDGEQLKWLWQEARRTNPQGRDGIV